MNTRPNRPAPDKRPAASDILVSAIRVVGKELMEHNPL